MNLTNLTNEQITELQNMSRVVTPAEEQALAQAYDKLRDLGFVLNGSNVLILLRSYNQHPTAPITTEGLVKFATEFREAFEWLSATELAYNQLTAQIGPEKTAQVIRLLNSHRLIAPPDENGKENFVALVRHSQSQGWGLDTNTFQRLIGHLQGTVHAPQLYWKPRPLQDYEKEEQRRKQSAEEAIKYNREQTRKNSPEFQEEERQKELARQKAQLTKDAADYWKQRVDSYLASIQSHTLRAEATQLFGTKIMNGNWQVNFVSLDQWLNRKKAEKLGMWA